MKKLLTRLALLMILCAALALPVFADAVTDSISVCIGYFGWSEDEYVEKAKFSWQELDDWYGGALDTHEEYYSYCNGSGRTYLVFARGFYIRDLLDYAGVDVNSIASIDFFTKDHSVGAYRSFTKYALLDQPRYYFPNLAGDAETGELYAWDGGNDLWVGAYQVEPMLALEDYTEWDTAGFDFESYADESLFSTGSRFHLFFGQASPEEAATSSAAKYVYKILVTFSGTPVLSSEESNLDLVVGSDHALHVTADAEDDALTAYVQEHLQYASSDPAVVSVDQYGRLHVNAEGDAVITASFGESSVSVQVHVGSGGASGTGSAAGEGAAPGGEAGTGQLDLPQPDETEAAPVTGPVDARSVYVLAGGAVSTGENGTTAGEGMQDGSVQLLLPDRQEAKTGPVWAALALSVLLGFSYGLIRYEKTAINFDKIHDEEGKKHAACCCNADRGRRIPHPRYSPRGVRGAGSAGHRAARSVFAGRGRARGLADLRILHGAPPSEARAARPHGDAAHRVRPGGRRGGKRPAPPAEGRPARAAAPPGLYRRYARGACHRAARARAGLV